MKPPMLRENIEPLIDALHSSGRSGDAALIEALLTERDEALKEIEKMKSTLSYSGQVTALISENERIKAERDEEKRRTAALVELAMIWSGKERATVLAEAQKLLAPSDSGGEKKGE